MKRIAIVTAGVLPVPAVRGGAVETLVDSLVIENERQGLLSIDVFGINDSEARVRSMDFARSRHIFVQPATWVDRLYDVWARVLGRLSPAGALPASPYLMRVMRAMRGAEYDYVVVENRPNYVTSLARRTQGKVVLHLHNDTLNARIPRAREIGAACSRVITVSNFIRDRVVGACSDEGLPVSTLHNCIDLPSFSRPVDRLSRREIREGYGYTDSDFIVVFVGRLDPGKGVRELVEAVAALKDTSIKLLIVGSTWYGPSSETAYSRELTARADGLLGRVRFAGYVPYMRMADIYRAADLAVVPSIWDEPAGMVVVEAMAAGLPLVVTDSGGIPEYCTTECAIVVKRDGKLTANLRDAIQSLAVDPDRRQEMSEAGLNRANLFDRPQYYRHFVQALND